MVNKVNSLSDLDLYAYTTSGVYLGGSFSWDNNIEMMDIPANQLTPSSTCILYVPADDIRIPAGAIAQFFYYAVAWTWVNDHAI